MTVHARTIPVLDERKVLSELQSLRSRQPVEYFAFYSSQLKGVVTDPALMVLPFDDTSCTADTAFSTRPRSSRERFTTSRHTSIAFCCRPSGQSCGSRPRERR